MRDNYLEFLIVEFARKVTEATGSCPIEVVLPARLFERVAEEVGARCVYVANDEGLPRSLRVETAGGPMLVSKAGVV